jgi:signal transduction histidine kinase
MAQATRTIHPAELRQRLPVPATGDELQNLGQAFNELLDRLQESFERQKQFTGNASHQLRTPLAIMLGQVEVALRRDRSAEEHRRVLVDVARQAGHLRQLIEMLLFLARADTEAMLPHLETIDLGDWLTAHIERWRTHARSADIHVEIEGGHPLLARAHPPLLGQLLDNLLDNACKYSEPGTPIRVRADETAKTCRLSIEDSGIGISHEDLPHLFEPFHRRSQTRRNGHEGVGLGLAVAERIALALGGRISAISQVGWGSCFTLELPLPVAGRAPAQEIERALNNPATEC